MSTHSSLNRLEIYAALKVPEVWRLEDLRLVCYLLAGGQYSVSPVSRAFPGLTVADLTRFLVLSGQMDENAIIRQLRVWVRQRFPGGGSPPPQP